MKRIHANINLDIRHTYHRLHTQENGRWQVVIIRVTFLCVRCNTAPMKWRSFLKCEEKRESPDYGNPLCDTILKVYSNNAQTNISGNRIYFDKLA